MLFKRRRAAAIAQNTAESDPGIEEITCYIEWLMTWYCHKPSVFLANIIVSRLESLREREQQGDPVDPEWSCHRLLRNWEYLAERSRARIRS